MRININRNEKTPLYLQISEQIKNMIYEGSLTDGHTLPSERRLAKELNIHRNTVIRAYSDLKDEGLISSYQGVGYSVSYRNMFYGMVKKPVNWEALVKDEYLGFSGDFDDLFSKTYDSDFISFAGGVASREIYPPGEIASVFERILTEQREKAYFYTPYQGDSQLRKEIADFMEKKGIVTDSGNIQIFSENNQAIDFLFTLMLHPKDKVVVAEPLSPDIYRTVRMAGGKLLTVPMDKNGMICDNLEALIEKENPKFICVDSSFNNPTGALLSVERRKKLLELSYKYRIPIIEEDEGSELYFDDNRIPSIKSMDSGNNVVYMYSFSLTMMPGVGISFAVADNSLIKRLNKLVSMRLTALDWAPQMLLLEYMKEGLFSRRLEKFRENYAKKQIIMQKCLTNIKEEFNIKYELPGGGVYFWVKLPDGMSARALLTEAEKRGVTFIPGNIFYPKKSAGGSYIRLNYSYPTIEQIEEGMKRLHSAMKIVQQKIQIK